MSAYQQHGCPLQSVGGRFNKAEDAVMSFCFHAFFLGHLPPHLARFQIRYAIMMVSLKLYRHLDNTTAEVSVIFQSDWKSVIPNRTASGPHEVLQ